MVLIYIALKFMIWQKCAFFFKLDRLQLNNKHIKRRYRIIFLFFKTLAKTKGDSLTRQIVKSTPMIKDQHTTGKR